MISRRRIRTDADEREAQFLLGELDEVVAVADALEFVARVQLHLLPVHQARLNVVDYLPRTRTCTHVHRPAHTHARHMSVHIYIMYTTVLVVLI